MIRHRTSTNKQSTYSILFVTNNLDIHCNERNTSNVRKVRRSEIGVALLTTLRWQLIADHNEWPNRIQFIPFFLNSSVRYHWIRNYWEVVNLLFVSPILFQYTWIYLKLRKYCNFGTKNVRLDVRATSFQRKKLNAS